MSLFLSFFVGLYIFSNLFNCPIPSIFFYIFLGVFSMLGLLTFVFFFSISQNHLLIDDKTIRLINLKNSSAINWQKINKIKIKRRTNGVIREIYIWSDNKSLFINAFENDFEKIEKLLKKSINANVLIKEITEPLDFDHILFYPILGLCIGAFCSLLLFALFHASPKNINLVTLSTGIYLFILGIYFFIKKPQHARDAKKHAITDYIFGLIFIIFSIILFLTRF
jgi:hypothetical protein